MKGFKSFLSVYPTSYKIFLYIVYPLVIMAAMFISIILNGAEAGKQITTVLMIMPGALGISVFMSGELFSNGNSFAKKYPFGTLILTSPKWEEYVTDYIIWDVLLKILVIPVAYILPHLIMMFAGAPGALPLNAAGAGIVVSAGSILGMFVLRKITYPVLVSLWMIGVIYIVVIGIVPFGVVFAPVQLKILSASISVIIAAVFGILSVGSMRKHIRRDFYEK